ncbi:MAG: crossover junction endodeoxyribonuclease RuvC [Candidatus Pacebacteria bacterium]|nr:crossover junction endodeoxyribonuclease RuvC [Candidatus Paceibacterota bacterium]
MMKSKMSTQTQNKVRVLSIDPGYGRMGVAVLQKEGGKEILLYSTCLEASPSLDHSKRLTYMGENLRKLFSEWKPDECALETLFFSKNSKTAMQVAESRGVVLYEAGRHKIPVYEYAPNAVKIAVTGYGRSGKKGVMSMIEKILTVGKKIEQDDEYDAIAVGLAHLSSRKSQIQTLINIRRR